MKKFIFIFIFALLSITTYAQKIMMGIDMAKPIENAVLILNKNDYTLDTKNSNEDVLIFLGEFDDKITVVTIQGDDKKLTSVSMSFPDVTFDKEKFSEYSTLYLKVFYTLNTNYNMTNLHILGDDPIKNENGSVVYAKSAATPEEGLRVLAEFYSIDTFHCVCVTYISSK